MLSSGQPYRSSPQHEAGKGLVRPGKVTPKDSKVDEEQAGRDNEEAHTEYEAMLHALLVVAKEVCCDEPGASEGCVAARNRCSHYAEDGKHSSGCTQPTYANLLDDNSGIAQSGKLLVSRCSFRSGQGAGELYGSSSPDEGHNTFRNHGSVEDGTSEALACHATCHEWALGSVEAAYRATGYGDTEQWEDGQSLRVVRHERSVRNLRHPAILRIDAPADAYSHQQEGKAKQRINLADELVDGQQGG